MDVDLWCLPAFVRVIPLLWELFWEKGLPRPQLGVGTGAHFWCCFLLEKQIKSSGREANA